jgi:hypothetical protein
MRRLAALTIVLTALCGFQPYALADGVGSALKSFGLIGSWSLNCAQNPNEATSHAESGIVPTRWSYENSLISNPTLTIMQRQTTGINVAKKEIRSAQQITSDKLKYTDVTTSVRFADNPEQKPKSQILLTPVVQKLGEKITVISQVSDDGTVYVENGRAIVRFPKNGQMVETNRVPFGLFEKCFD